MEIQDLRDALESDIDLCKGLAPKAKAPTSRSALTGLGAELATARAELEGAQAFLFDDDAAPAHLAFGVALHGAKLFALPYERVVYRLPWRFRGTAATARPITLVAWQPGGAGSAVHAAAYSIAKPGDQGRSFLHGMITIEPPAIPTIDHDAETEEVTPWVRLSPTWELYRAIAAERASATAPPRERLEEIGLDLARALIGLTGALSCREVKQGQPETMDKLNAARAKKGKAPLLDHRTVYLRAVNGGEGGSYRLESGRRSPRTHWRRGHIRRLPNDRLAVVPPCIVRPGAETAVTHDYKVHVGEPA